MQKKKIAIRFMTMFILLIIATGLTGFKYANANMPANTVSQVK